MALTFNGSALSIAKKQKINGNDVTKITFNDTTVWQYDTSTHTASLTSSILTRTGGSTDLSWSDGVGGKDGTVLSDSESFAFNYARRRSEVRAFWTGGSMSVDCSYTGVINKLNLPNGSEVKTLIVYKYSGQTQTINVANVNTVSVSDTHGDSSGIATQSSASLDVYAGISRIDYKYV